jgi:hypothetical protein
VDKYCSKALTILNVQNAHGAATDFGQAAREKILEEVPRLQNFDILVQAAEQANRASGSSTSAQSLRHCKGALSRLQARSTDS